MTTSWFTADLHFGHKKVSEIRGFETTDEHDKTIVTTWRQQVRPGDRVFVLGDISGGSRAAEERALDIIATLPGEKHLTSGNHDSPASIHRNGWRRYDRFREVFASVRDFAKIRSQKQTILLSHYPYASAGDGPDREGARYLEFRLPDYGFPLVHAHTHQDDPATSEHQICVSWDAWGRLASMHEIERYFFDI